MKRTVRQHLLIRAKLLQAEASEVRSHLEELKQHSIVDDKTLQVIESGRLQLEREAHEYLITALHVPDDL